MKWISKDGFLKKKKKQKKQYWYENYNYLSYSALQLLIRFTFIMKSGNRAPLKIEARVPEYAEICMIYSLLTSLAEHFRK